MKAPKAQIINVEIIAANEVSCGARVHEGWFCQVNKNDGI
jgi:hypothetical protein